MKKAIGVISMSVKHKKIILAVALIFAVNILIIALAQSADAALYKRGSSGATVTQIQTRLKSWGYYSGSVDGIYGSATERAVKYFQRTNGLTVDGQAGDKTLAALGIYEQSGSGSAVSGDVYLLAKVPGEYMVLRTDESGYHVKRFLYIEGNMMVMYDDTKGSYEVSHIEPYIKTERQQ